MLHSPFRTLASNLVAIAAATFLISCTTPAQKYAAANPDLSSEHRAILQAGKIPDGLAVAGMTKEQVRLAMGKSPTQFTTINGVDAWVYAKESDTQELALRNAEITGLQGKPGSTGAPNETQSTTPHVKTSSKTIIFFHGDHAIRADVSREEVKEQ